MGGESNTDRHNAAISACVHASEWTYALDLLSSMRREDVESNTDRYNAATCACEKASEWTVTR